MKSAAALVLVTSLVLALLFKSGLMLESAARQPQTSPPKQAEPKAEKPEVTEDYEEAMNENERKVILVFGAEWCPHCVVLKNNLKDMNLEGYLVCLIDVDKNKDAQRKHSVRLLPTSVMLESGKEISREKGFDKARFEAWLEHNR